MGSSIEDLERRTFQWFWEHSDAKTGLTLDRTSTAGVPPAPWKSHHKVATIAATGFALSGYCISADRGWVTREQAKERARTTLAAPAFGVRVHERVGCDVVRLAGRADQHAGGGE